MKRRLFVLVFVTWIGMGTSSGILTAADGFTPKQPEFNAVQTIEEVKTENDNTVKSEAESKTQEAPQNIISVKPVMKQTVTPVYSGPVNNIKIGGRILEIVNVASTTVDAGNHVNRYGEKFLYGHNSANVFSILPSIGIGNVFSVTLNGVTRNYRVSKTVIFEKNSSNGRLQLDGNGSYMNSVAKAVFQGAHHDLSIMTCYGTSYGNGDASHRFVIFADAI